MTPKQVLQLVKTKKIEFIDCRFMDFPGLWQHKTYVASELTEATFKTGFGFDGSTVRGWQRVNESDMILLPVADTARVDPFFEHPTLTFICDVKDPITKKEYSRDPRSLARKAANYLKKTGIADTAYFGPEMEFFIFDSVSYGQSINAASYSIDSIEGIWNSVKADPANLGNQVRPKEGYFPIPPMDTMQNLRSEIVDVMLAMGLPVEGHHHEVATGGQGEVDLRQQDLLTMADTCMMYKYVVKSVAARHGRVATFMPKPLFGDNGSGMHTHFSLFKGKKPLMAGRHYAGLSQLGLHVIGGLLKHAKSLIAFTNPTTNSFKRLVPGYEAPTQLTYSSRNRTAAIRVPVYSDNPETKRVEFRCPDSSCNPYLAFSAMMMAAIDGIKNQIDPGSPVDKEMSDLDPAELAGIDAVPHDLNEALNELEKDHAYLLEGGVFSEDIIKGWIQYKREIEVAGLRARPHPHKFRMYFDV